MIKEMRVGNNHNEFIRHLMQPFSYNLNIFDLSGQQYLVGMRFEFEGEILSIKGKFWSSPILLEE